MKEKCNEILKILNCVIIVRFLIFLKKYFNWMKLKDEKS